MYEPLRTSDASASNGHEGLQKPLHALLGPRTRRNPGLLLGDRAGSTFVKMVETAGIEPASAIA